MKRLAAEPPAAPLFVPLTNMLLDYAESAVLKEKHVEIYAAENRSDLLRRLKALTGKDLLDFGIDMFGYYEKMAPPAFVANIIFRPMREPVHSVQATKASPLASSEIVGAVLL